MEYEIFALILYDSPSRRCWFLSSINHTVGRMPKIILFNFLRFCIALIITPGPVAPPAIGGG